MTNLSPDVHVRSIDAANAEAFERLCAAEPVLIDVLQAVEIVPRMTRETILTSGAQLEWDEYRGGQRAGVLGGAMFEGLAATPEEADAAIRAGRIQVRSCQDFGCAGSLAGIYTASMPVLVVENQNGGNRGFCNLFEGKSPARLNYGVYNNDVRRNLMFLQDVVAPVLGEAVRLAGGIPLRPIVRRALHMGDELHSRNTAATLIFTRELFRFLLELAPRMSVERMAKANLAMYGITVGEHPEFRIPYFGFRGVPVAIDVHRVAATGVTPIMDIGVAGRNGGQIGAGSFRAPIECFQAAAEAHAERYGSG